MIKLENISFDHCLKCTVCTIYCPVARATGLFPGPKMMGPDTERLRIKNPELVDDSLKYCSNCKRCETVCPSDVRIADIIQNAKWKYARRLRRPRDFLLSRTDAMGRLATTMAPLVNLVTASRWGRRCIEALLAVPAHRTFPAYARVTFSEWFKKQAPDQDRFPDRVVYFHGCYVNYNDPDLGRAVVRLLNAMNHGVVLAREKCCGVPLIANGYLDQARRNARHNIRILGQAAPDRRTRIIASSSTCTLALKQEYPNLLGLDAGPIAGRVDYITHFLARVFRQGRGPRIKPVPLVVAYHAPCHLERLGGTIDTIEVLRRIPGLDVRLVHSECCGLAGTYGFKSEFDPIAQTVGADLFRSLETIQPDMVATDCETCKWQIEMNTAFPVVHPVILLDRALDR